VVSRILPGEKAGPARAAQRSWHDELRAEQPLIGNHRFRVRHELLRESVMTLVIDHDNEEVRTLILPE
jgi:hypothetical protein